jgi:hypothetical protein
MLILKRLRHPNLIQLYEVSVFSEKSIWIKYFEIERMIVKNEKPIIYL